MTSQRITRQGWLILTGVPTLFFCAYILAGHQGLLNLPLCAVKLFLGIDCPGCGITRSIAFLSRGEIHRSIMFHPLGIIVSLWLAYLLIKTLSEIVLRRQLKPVLSRRAKDILLIAFVAALMAQWIAKLIITMSL